MADFLCGKQKDPVPGALVNGGGIHSCRTQEKSSCGGAMMSSAGGMLHLRGLQTPGGQCQDTAECRGLGSRERAGLESRSRDRQHADVPGGHGACMSKPCGLSPLPQSPSEMTEKETSRDKMIGHNEILQKGK